MSTSPKIVPGTIFHVDITVADAEALRDFYKQVVGWDSKGEPMGDYEDYHMIAPASGQPVAGICHARGQNAALPPQWLIYIIVEDLDKSVGECLRLGGETITPVTDYGTHRFCVVRDPAGAAFALGEIKSE